MYFDILNRLGVSHEFDEQTCGQTLRYRTDSTDSRTIQWFYSAQRLDLFAWCVKLSRLLVGFRMHFKSLHFHFIHFIEKATLHYTYQRGQWQSDMAPLRAMRKLHRNADYSW